MNSFVLTLNIVCIYLILVLSIGELVGAGSFGQVFGGILTQTGKRIAVKEVFLSGTKGHIEQAKALEGIALLSYPPQHTCTCSIA
jgi:hypothetical protein